MSQFFKNLSTEPESPKKKQQKQVIYEEEQDRTSHSEKKINELHEEIMRIEESVNNKNVEEFLKNLKKYKSALKVAPKFLFNFFKTIQESDVSSGVKTRAKKAAAGYTFEEEKKVEEKKEEIVKEVIVDNEIILEKKLEKIFKMKNIDEKEILILTSEFEEENLKFKIYHTLLSLRIHGNDFDKIIETLNILLEMLKNGKSFKFLENDLSKMFSDNVHFYAKKALDLVKEDDKTKMEVFDKLLKDLSHFKNEKFEIIKLKFAFFYKKEVVENDTPIFRLMYLYKIDNLKESIEHYENIFKKITDKNDLYFLVLNEFGEYLFKKENFLLAFKVLQEVYYFGKIKINKSILNICTILVEEEIVDEQFYDEFIDGTRVIDENPFLLKGNKEDDIYRAYFYKANFDIENCVEILKSEGIECEEIIKTSVMKRLEKL